jgi:hypothetical protein
MKLRLTLPTPKALTKFSMSFSISDECKQVIPKIYGQSTDNWKGQKGAVGS